MDETESELRELQGLIDASLGRSTAHLQSIITGERSLTAEQLARVLTGMCVLALATVTAQGEPRISAVDGHLLHGRWVFGTSRGAAKARHLRARPAASAAHLRGEDLGVFVTASSRRSTPRTAPATPTGRRPTSTCTRSTATRPSTGPRSCTSGSSPGG